MKPPCVMFGVPIDHATMADTLDRIDEFVADGRRLGRTHQIATVNVDFLVNAITNRELLDLLQHTEFNFADGMPVVWGAARLGTPLPERVAGSDLVPLLAQQSARRGWRVHLFGGAPGVADRARTLLMERYPDALLTADDGPVIRDVTAIDSSLIDRINQHKPDILCVALGNPKQERFIAAQRERLGCPVMIGIGGSLDMLVGDRKRAPRWAQRIGAEWIFRAAQEPGRLGRRYLHDVRVFGPRLVGYVKSVRGYRNASSLTACLENGGIVVRRCSLPDRGEGWSEALFDMADVAFVRVDLDGMTSINPFGHASLVGLIRTALRHGVPVTGTPSSADLIRCLDDYGTGSWLAASIDGFEPF
jgi:N-acetylglucosaminyldiphosphoundecaprenol N-acetyl-beta-D-mannosaminyltransferase